MEGTEAVKAYATEKIARIQRFLRQPLHGQVVLSCQNHRLHTAEVDLHAGGDRFHAHETSEDMYATVDLVVDKIERQVVHHKEIVGAHKGAERAVAHLPIEASYQTGQVLEPLRARAK